MKDTLFYKGCFGIERETLRVDSRGRLAMTPHPFGDDEQMTRDFCENQTELITPICDSVHEAVIKLKELDRKARGILNKNGESIWLYSNPPHFENEDEIPVADFKGEMSGKRVYREALERRYGKRLMLFSGVHFNFSFDDEYLYSISGGRDLEEFRNDFYLKLYKHLAVNSWLMLLLTAASPKYDRSLDGDGLAGEVTSEYASLRSGERGYWNAFVPLLKFESLESFIGSIKFYVDKGILFSASELYLPVRLKPNGVNSLESFKNGVSHIELRMFDLYPENDAGVNERDLEFAHLFIMYLSKQKDFVFTDDMQIEAVKNHKRAALYELDGVKISGVPIIEKANGILSMMRDMFSDDEAALEIIDYEKEKLRARENAGEYFRYTPYA